MAGISINGVAYDVSEGGEGEPILVGEESRSFSGSLRSSVRGEKRTFQVTTIPYSEAIWDTFRSTVDQGAQVPVTGVLMSNDTLTMSVRRSAKLVSGVVPNLWVITASGQEV